MFAAHLPATRALLWLLVYVVAVTAPLFALLPGANSGRGFTWDFAMALGYAGLAMFGMLFALTARFRRATAPFGIDIVYYFHRYLALWALGVIGVHYAVLRVWHPATLGAADPSVAASHMTAGRVALALFVLIALTSLARKRLNLDYDLWRITHALAATLAFGAALYHVHGAGRLLDTPGKRALWIGYGTFWLALILYVRVVRPWRITRAPWRVADVRPERGRVTTLVLEPAAAGAGLRFAPGQFVWLSLHASPFAMREHPFSIASSAEQPRRIELSIKALGDFSAAVAAIRPGEVAWLDAPYGTFGIDEYQEAAGFVFVAGGVGIAPILSMLRTLADRGDRRPLLLFYGNRVWDRVAFREELESEGLSRRLDLKVVHVLQEPPPHWQGEVGFVTEDVLRRHLPAARDSFEVLLCGPTPMTKCVERSLATLGVPAARVHSEIFDWV